ncbi:MAG: polyprenyl synthetase family protein [Alicyclobacillaceae bacterium]|nr:polyprenyl synthetase family protein [Alicyclobacillaceae bacterium]
MTFNDLYRTMSGELRLVEHILETEIESREPALEQASLYLLQSGGKRLRPLVVLLSGRFGVRRRSEVLARSAAALEMIHMATLVHDDVIDQADTRRGKPTMKAAWGDQMALYAGDFLLARALELLATVSDRRLHETTAGAIAEMCLGELEQIHDLFRSDQSLFRYFRRIRRKTALLMAVSCFVGARVSEADAPKTRTLWRFGYHLGMAFQIIDDILDLTGDVSVLGKPVGHDLVQGNLTLPVLLALRDSVLRRRFAPIIRPGMTREEAEEVAEAVRRSGGVEQARRVAEDYVRRARKDLAELPPSWAREALDAVVEFVAVRDR